VAYVTCGKALPSAGYSVVPSLAVLARRAHTTLAEILPKISGSFTWFTSFTSNFRGKHVNVTKSLRKGA
jgi:hypothetical protein